VQPAEVGCSARFLFAIHLLFFFPAFKRQTASFLSIHVSAMNADADRLLATLTAAGLATSVQLQQALRKSQPTVSRLLSELKPQVLVLGAGRATRYGLAQPILHHAAQQPLWWADESGALQPFGQLSLLASDVLHIEGDGFASVTRARACLGSLLRSSHKASWAVWWPSASVLLA
jgi:hypothetical protein